MCTNLLSYIHVTCLLNRAKNIACFTNYDVKRKIREQLKIIGEISWEYQGISSMTFGRNPEKGFGRLWKAKS